MSKTITLPSLSSLELDISNQTWWHQVAAYAAIVVGAIDPSNFASHTVQTVIIAIGGLIAACDVTGKHRVKAATIAASAATTAAAAGTTTTIISKGA